MLDYFNSLSYYLLGINFIVSNNYLPCYFEEKVLTASARENNLNKENSKA